MTVLIQLIADYSFWFYGLCGLGILLCLRSALMANRERGRSLFTLEKEAASSRIYRAMSMSLVLLAVGAGIFYVANFLEPNLVFLAQEPTPTLVLFPTPTLTLSPSTATPRPTPTRIPYTPGPVVSTPTPTPTSLPLPLCPNPQARLTYPTVGAVLKGAVQIQGSANIDNFQYYKFEFKSEGASEWSFLRRFDEPVASGVLGTWDTSGLPAGSYLFRLVVVDKTGNYERCEVKVLVER